jgi:hypothetical protein
MISQMTVRAATRAPSDRQDDASTSLIVTSSSRRQQRRELAKWPRADTKRKRFSVVQHADNRRIN